MKNNLSKQKRSTPTKQLSLYGVDRLINHTHSGRLSTHKKITWSFE
ncbi:MAG: hypothetical protein L3J71_18530 [Victivallaceae bacterium]|nr:hypothetical protein [Victivallaceae bacterium]